MPDEVKQLYLGTTVTGTVVTTKVDGAPQRVIRTELVDRLEALAGCAPAACRAQRPAVPQETGTTMSSLCARDGP